MPVYEYKCDTCGHQLETFQKMSAEPLSRCPQCDTDALRKLVSAVSFRLRGTGWYETDFKNRPAHSRSSDRDSEGGSGRGSDTGDKDTGGRDGEARSAPDSDAGGGKGKGKGNEASSGAPSAGDASPSGNQGAGVSRGDSPKSATPG